MAESISHIKIGNQEHPIDAVTVNGLTFTSAEKALWNNKQDALTFDSIPTENSENPVYSGGVYSMVVDNEIVIATALNDLNDRIVELEDSSSSEPDYYTKTESDNTFVKISSMDSIPVENSNNPVKSGGLYKVITDNEYVIATALNDLDERLEYIELNGATGGVVEESDPIFAQSAAYGISSYDISEWNGKGNGTITGITMNGSSKGTSGTVDLGTVVTGVSFISTAASVSISGGVARISFTFDSLPTENSNNLVKSGDLYTVITQNEFVAATAINELNDRLEAIETGAGGGGASDTITGITMNGSSKGTSGIVNLGTVVTGISVNGTAVSVSNGLANISISAGSSVTESTVSGWGFTKNTGTITGISMNGSSKGVSGNVDLGNVVTAVSFNGTAASISNGVASITATIPTVNNSTITIQKNGTTVDSFTTNAASNKTINITVNELPAATSSDVNGTSGKILVAAYDSTNGYHWEKTGNVTLYNNGQIAVPGSVGTTYLDTTGVFRTDRSSWDWIWTRTGTNTAKTLQSDLDAIRQLPAVTSSQNGQVLQVVNGQWTLVTPVSIYSGSSNPNNSQGTNGDLYLQTS